MSGSTVFEGRATLSIADFLEALQKMRTESQETAREIRAEFQKVAAAMRTTRTATRGATAATAAQRRAEERHQASVQRGNQRAQAASQLARERQQASLRRTDERHQYSMQRMQTRHQASEQLAVTRSQNAAQRSAARSAEAERRSSARRARLAGMGGMGGGGRRAGLGFSGGSPFGGNVLDDWARQLKTVEDRFNSIFRAGTQISELGFIIGLPVAALSALGVGLVSSAKEFDAWITKAYAGAQAAGEVGVSMAKFEESAHRVAQTVGSFNPTQVAESFYHWQTAIGTVVETEKDLINTEVALQAALMAGAIAKIDSTTAVRGLASVLFEFEMGSVRALDVTAKLMNASQISAVEFGELLQSYRMIGPTLHGVGVELEESLAILTGLADVGQRGTMAGRALGQVIQHLIKPSKEAASAMDELFEKAFDKTHQEIFFQKDAEGVERFIGLIDRVNEKGEVHRGVLFHLAEATKNLTEAEKHQFLATITSQNAYRALLPLMMDYEKGSERIAKRYQEFVKVNADGSSEQIRLFLKQWDIYKGTIEVGFGQQMNRIKETAIELGRVVAFAILPILKYFADAAQIVLEWAKANHNLVGGITLVATAIVGLGTALAGGFFILGQYIQAFAALRVVVLSFGALATTVLGSWLTAFMAMAVVLAIVVLGLKAYQENVFGLATFTEGAVEYAKNVLAGFLMSVNSFIQMIAAFIAGDWAAAWQHFLDILSNVGALLVTVLANIAPAILDVFGNILSSVGNVVEAFFPGFRAWGEGLMLSFASGILDAAAYVVEAALSVIDMFSVFFATASPPKAGPLQFINTWGRELMNEYMKGMKSADFKIINDVLGVIEKQLNAQMRDGKLSPGEFFSRNMSARQTLTHYASRVRQSVEGGDPLSDKELAWRMTELTGVLGSGNYFINEMMNAYSNLAPLEMAIELEKEKLDVLKDQKRELDAQVDLYRREFEVETFDQSEELRKLKLQLSILRKQNDIEELGLPSTTSSKADRAQRAANRGVRKANAEEEHAIKARIAEIELGLMAKEGELHDKTAPLRKLAAERALEAARSELEINEKIKAAAPWKEKVAAAKAALDFEERIYAIAKQAADFHNQQVAAAAAAAKKKGAGGGKKPKKPAVPKFGAGGDGGKAFRDQADRRKKEIEDAAQKWVDEFVKQTQKGFDNAIKPFTKFSDDVEGNRKRVRGSLEKYQHDFDDFIVGIRTLMSGGQLSAVPPVPTNWGFDEETGSVYVSETRKRNFPQWMKDRDRWGFDEETGAVSSPRDRITAGAERTALLGGGAFGGAMLFQSLASRFQANRAVTELDRALDRANLNADGSLFGGSGRLTLRGSRILHDVQQIDPGTLRRLLGDLNDIGRFRGSTMASLGRSTAGNTSLRRLLGQMDDQDPRGVLQALLRVRGMRPDLLAEAVETGSLPGRSGRFVGRAAGFMGANVGDAFRNFGGMPAVFDRMARWMRNLTSLGLGTPLIGEDAEMFGSRRFAGLGRPRVNGRALLDRLFGSSLLSDDAAEFGRARRFSPFEGARSTLSGMGRQFGGPVHTRRRRLLGMGEAPAPQLPRQGGRTVGGALRGGARLSAAGIKEVTGALGDLLKFNNQINRFVGRLLGLNRLGRAVGPVSAVAGAVAKLAGQVSGITPLARGLLRILRVFGRLIPIVGWILTLVDVVILLRKAWTTNFAGIRTEVEKAYNVIAPAFEKIKGAVQDLFSGNISFQQFLNRISPELQKIGSALGTLLSTVGENLARILTDIALDIWGWISTTGLQIAGDIAKWAFESLVKAAGSLLENRSEIIEEFFRVITFLFFAPVGIIYRVGKWLIEEGVPRFVKELKAFLFGTADTTGEEMSAAESSGKGFVSNLKTWLTTAFNNFLSWVRGGGLSTLINNIWTEVWARVKNIGRGIVLGGAAAFGVSAEDAESLAARIFGSRHSGGGIDRTGYYFLDQGEYVLSGQDIQRFLSLSGYMENLARHTQAAMGGGSLGGLSVGGTLNVNVNVGGSGAGMIDDSAKEQIIETVIDGITQVFKRR